MKAKKIISLGCISAIAAAAIAVNCIAFANKDVLNQWAAVTKLNVSDEDLGELMADGQELATTVEAEGAVLAQNKNSILPLAKTYDEQGNLANKVNVFGWSSTQWIQGGSGSGRVNNVQVDFLQALRDYGVETNSALTDMYTDFLGSRPKFNNSEGSLNTYDSDFNVLYEPNINNRNLYTDALLDDAKTFSSTAFVVLGRVSGESTDQPKVQYYSNTKGGANKKTDTERTYLDISQDEDDLLDYVSANYEKTVVIVNSASMLNLSFLKKYPGIDSCLVVGTTGDSAANALPGLLYGDVSPSGRFSDTYPYDFHTMASYANSSADLNGAWGQYTNGAGLYPADGTQNGNVGNSSAKYPGVSYVDYAEDIYIGYKWYETADAEGYFDSVSNEYGQGYDGVVQYPFGYGLSYSTFEKKITGLSLPRNSAISGNDEIKVTVTVKNTGSVKAAEAVQLYLSRPYYEGGIEKPAVELIDIGKTLVLDPGASEDVDLTAKVSDFASYDAYDKNANGFRGYEIEKGDYGLMLMDNAHVLAGSESDSVVTYRVDADIEQDTDPVTGAAVENRFLDTSYDGIAIDGSDSDQDITYLSRSDFAGTFPSEPDPNRAMSTELKKNNLYTASMANAEIDESDADITTGAENGLSITDENGEVNQLGLDLGKDFDDPRWNELLDQITIDEMTKSTLHGYVHNEAIPSIGKPATKEADGPAQVGSFNMPNYGVGYPNATVIAQTFDKNIAYKYGKQLGKEANFCGYDGWYAPGVNLHRSPFGGRNYEYYSEDAYLSGIMGAYTIKGSLNVGTYVYLKHFIAYEQETYRDGLYTWLTEQNLRENYLKPFKMAVQIGGCTGIMTSYNRLGATWASGNHNLIKDVLMGEWGFKGAIITDYADHQHFMDMDQALRAGTTLYMDGYLNNGKYDYETSSNTFKQALRAATKRNVYTYLNAKYQLDYFNKNGDEQFAPIHKGESFIWWGYVLGGFDALVVAGLGTWLYFVFRKKKA